jgi:hypothetical protein
MYFTLCCRIVEGETSSVRKLEREVCSLQADVRSLFRKYQRLQVALQERGPTVDLDAGQAGACGGPVDVTGPAGPSSSAAPSYNAAPTYNGATLKVLRASVAHMGADTPKKIIKTLALRLFSGKELNGRSITGKRSVKSADAAPRPPLDGERMELLEKLVRERCPDTTHKELVETVQNLQKVLRQQDKKNQEKTKAI